ncbi:large proline-rich protein bag6-B isoform X1 [Anastrepha ludens]|uniref:large proline-rich protein bag6-B isoform X1 n=1 Tax=Anastrepha ludens TaxID=28586 RepID=UPI0023AF30C7|nr:large proline-rich protein bag6-B isoform X1 [Anastrepha ludens]XP_053955683.1 large proline-rich protein bag6-B isoform X1 [Anastrepha ludens]
MLINLRVKTLDAQTHDFSIDNELTIRQFKDKIAEKTNIAADQQRIIYCGRVLADEKQLKEYDVDGKVVHVAERPPPSQRDPSTSNSSSNEAPSARERPNNRGGMRNSPLFRALDGMVVGTMAIPMNPVQNNVQQPVNPFAVSSSFCVNRITVARHMLDCANNIAAYLEDPERGLNNSSLDILARGSWTMESTVVEVGFTAADLPQNQNIVEMVQDAVSAALRRNNNTNVTVVQLPTVFGSNEGENGATNSGEAAADMDASNDDGGAVDADGAAVIIEDVIDDTFDAVGANIGVTSNTSGTDTANNITSPNHTSTDTSAGDTSNASATTGTNTDENPSRRRTNTRVLAEVVAQMRTVQTRLNPFIQQFYELLNNDPTFDEDNTTERENAQRLYNRVSEALHYMSHAQHAISDLMLDVSQPAPRFLTCRPILVEQSGYVSSNNYLSAAAAAAAAAATTGNNQTRPRTRAYIAPRYNHPVTITTSSPPTTASGNGTVSGNSAVATAGNNNSNNRNTNSTNASASGSGSGSSVEDPVDEPLVTPSNTPSTAAATNASTQSNDTPHAQMSRLIQAMVNSAPINTELHVQILPPSLLNVAVNPRGNNGNGEQQQRTQSGASAGAADATATANNSTTGNNDFNNANASGGGGGGGSSSRNASARAGTRLSNDRNSNNSVPATGASLPATTRLRPVSASLAIGTLPTTSTQTRSTSRPQLQIGGIPANGWNGRFIPANMISAFDRFLPCNSHHIREPESNANNNSTAGANVTTNNASPQIIIGGSPTSTPRTNAPSAPILPPPFILPEFYSSRNIISGQNRNASTAAPSTETSATSGSTNTGTDNYRRNLRTQLVNLVNQRIFRGEPINEDTVTPAVNRAAEWFDEALLVLLPHYEKPEYDSRHSVTNIFRHMLPLFIEIVRDEQSNPATFEQRIKKICEDFLNRLYSVLSVCVDRSRVINYWVQLMSQFSVPMRLFLKDEALQFLRSYVDRRPPSTIDTADAQQFIVHRNVTPVSEPADTPLESDVEMVEMASTSDAKHSSQFTIDMDDEVEIELTPAEQLPDVTVGSELWHSNFPNDWLPIIARDLCTQSANPPNQIPFSDAYISGMSAKRRKMIQNNKPPTEISSLIARSVRKAIQTVGPRASTTATTETLTADEITETIANDVAVNASYTEAVRTHVRERLKKDSDYKPDKYPHATKFVNK